MQNRLRTELPRHNSPNKVGDYVLISDDYIQCCYMFFVLFSCDYEFCYNTNKIFWKRHIKHVKIYEIRIVHHLNVKFL